MPIVVECGCGKRLKAGDKSAGKTAKCPACGNPVTVPMPNGIGLGNGNPFASPDREMPRPQAAATKKPQPQSAFPQLDLGNNDRSSVPTASTTKPCPFCGEQVLDVAKKCKHCGEFLDPSLKQAREASKWNPGIAALLSLLLPGAGQMYKGQVGTGIVQLIGTGFAYASNLFFGACLHLAIVIHAAVANPSRKSGSASATTVAGKSQAQRSRDIKIAMGLILGLLLFLAWYILTAMAKQH